jgi:hypothetical protein
MFVFGSSDGNIQLYERLNDVCTVGLSDVTCAHCCIGHFSNSGAVPLPTLVRSSRWHVTGSCLSGHSSVKVWGESEVVSEFLLHDSYV